jgi:chromosome segregation ATPase
MSWYAPNDHRQGMLQEVSQLRKEAASASTDVGARTTTLQQAQSAVLAFESAETELAEVRQRLSLLQNRNQTLDRQRQKTDEMNRVLSEDLDLLRSERIQAERLAVEVGVELSATEESFRRAQADLKLLRTRTRRYTEDLGVVEEIVATVDEMKSQVSALHLELDELRGKEVEIAADVDDHRELLAEEEMLHEALISDLALQQDTLRRLRQRSSLSEKANTVNAFFREANAMAKRALSLQPMDDVAAPLRAVDESPARRNGGSFSQHVQPPLSPTPTASSTTSVRRGTPTAATTTTAAPADRAQQAAAAKGEARAGVARSILSQLQRFDTEEVVYRQGAAAGPLVEG